MSVLLAVDPGIRGCGAAMFAGGELVRAGYVASPCKDGCGAFESSTMAHYIAGRFTAPWTVNELAVEWPRVYATMIRQGRSKGDPNDLLALAGVDSALAALLSHAKATSYAPSDWKGQMTKEACHMRIMSRLTAPEGAVAARAALEAKSKAHNMMDAVGIGLHHLGRLKRVRVIPT